MTESTPPGVDPALWSEFEQLSKQVHQLYRQRVNEADAPAPPTRRLVVDVPEEWFLLFAWIDNRMRHRRYGDDGATGLTAERIEFHERSMRRRVAAYIQTVLNNDFHTELHMLAIGASPLLRPQPPPNAKPAAATGDDPDDALPF